MAETFFDRVLERRDRERTRDRSGTVKISAADALLETNRQGTMRWYQHPDIEGSCMRSSIVYRYEIAPGGGTGKQRVQGNVVSFVIQGSGHTVVNGTSHEWGPGDVIGIPPVQNGIVVQHFNTSDEEAQLITVEPNYYDSFSVDMGSGFEQLEDAPTAES
jgi:quercetin dioxygenase-like cupin family protein